MRVFAIHLAACFAVSLLACGREGAPSAADPGQSAGEGTDPADEAPEDDPAPVFSEEAAAELFAAIEACTSRLACEPLDTLAGFGADVAPQARALVADEGTPPQTRGLIMTLMGELALEVDLVPLYEAVRASDDRDLRAGFESLLAALAPTHDALAESLRADLLDEDRVLQLPVRRMLRHVGGTLEWAFERLEGEHDERHATTFADLIADLAEAEHLPRVIALIEAAPRVMARHRLAAAAIALGDRSHFGVLLDGLRLDNPFDRADAANLLARVADHLPAEHRDEAIDLLRAGLERAAGDLTAGGFEQSLRALGAD